MTKWFDLLYVTIKLQVYFYASLICNGC